MPDASYRCLVLDATDPGAVAHFWATALHRELRAGDEEWLVQASEPGVADHLWVERVPEARGAKNRVHLDLRLPRPDPAPLVAAGATVLRSPGEGGSWWVLTDPEGDELCAMPPAPVEWGLPVVDVPTPFELIVDTGDPEAQARWWAERLGGKAATRKGVEFWWVEDADGFPWLFWVFTPVPEPKTVKNRMHWDVWLEGETPQPLLDAGAALLRAPDDDIAWWVLADPEGNEFCAFPASARS